MDMLKVNIMIEKEDIDVQDAVSNSSNKDLHKNSRVISKDTMDQNANIVVETIYSLSKDLWSKERVENELQSSSELGDIIDENLDSEANQDRSKSVSESTGGVSGEEFAAGSSATTGSTRSSLFEEMPGKEKNKPPSNAKKILKLSTSRRYELQKRYLDCGYCGESIMYRKYVKHCKIIHPSSPWNTLKICGSCKHHVPEVLFNFHQQLFGHKGVHENQSVDLSQETMEIGRNTNEETPITKKRQTKFPCDYCGEQVTLANYVKHCKKLHSISDADERCRRKCYKCGAKVHIIAEKFHDQIFHSEKPKTAPGKPEPLKIVQHNKQLTPVQCEYCHVKVGFMTYKSHVRNKHPEIDSAEIVKCRKCGSNIPGISFKFHREIFHPSKLKLSPKFLPSRKPKVPCPHCDARVKPHIMFWHVKTVHGGDKTDLPAITATERESFSDEQSSELKPDTASDISEVEVKKESADSDSSFEMILNEDPRVKD
eukprot:GFUD01029553.1.p1 GENE.GFUD01029553.1~~GFUD01029553.1.p1  ORF type:complete len:484 (+),score=99.91 GFUD01029553.1:1-1452(+)